MVKVERLERWAEPRAFEDEHGTTGSDRDETRIGGREGGERVEIQATDGVRGDVGVDRGLRGAEIEPADRLVFGGSGDEVIVGVPDYGFDVPVMCTGTDFESGRGWCFGGLGKGVGSAGPVGVGRPGWRGV